MEQNYQTIKSYFIFGILGLMSAILFVIFVLYISPAVSGSLISKYEVPIKFNPEYVGRGMLDAPIQPKILTSWFKIKSVIFYLLLAVSAVLGVASLIKKGIANKLLGLLTLLILGGILLYLNPPISLF